jgi:hypothetical protein
LLHGCDLPSQSTNDDDQANILDNDSAAVRDDRLILRNENAVMYANDARW